MSEPLPEFEAPPLVEVAVGVQFNQVPLIRPIELGSLRETWRSRYPVVQEQPPLPPQLEAAEPGMPTFQVMVGGPQPRMWFLSDNGSELVQLQSDRLIVNWRETADEQLYPRFPAVRSLFTERVADLESFTGAELAFTQVEVTYINAIDPHGSIGAAERVLRNWLPLEGHHLEAPEQARTALVFSVPDLGRPPVRMYVASDPSQRPDGRLTFFLTLTVRGAPTDDSLDAALAFIDGAHEHIVRSFAELTPPEMHDEWRRTQ